MGPDRRAGKWGLGSLCRLAPPLLTARRLGRMERVFAGVRHPDFLLLAPLRAGRILVVVTDEVEGDPAVLARAGGHPEVGMTRIEHRARHSFPIVLVALALDPAFDLLLEEGQFMKGIQCGLRREEPGKPGLSHFGAGQSVVVGLVGRGRSGGQERETTDQYGEQGAGHDVRCLFVRG